MKKNVKSTRRRPVQERGQATCAAILSAARDMLAHDGAASLTTNAIAARANMSIGSLYQYYPSKQAILTELLRGMRAATLADMEAADSAADQADDLDAAMAALMWAGVQERLRHPALCRALDALADSLPPDDAAARLARRASALPVALLAEHRLRDPERVAAELTGLAQGLADAAARHGGATLSPDAGPGADAGADPARAALRARMTRAIAGYLAP